MTRLNMLCEVATVPTVAQRDGLMADEKDKHSSNMNRSSLVVDAGSPIWIRLKCEIPRKKVFRLARLL